ncbi:hypothetical protein FKR81_10480 [Lentzea tibetensis]|uniref:HTH luxR-type domain-containing protein n=1 Tax=Lentzea tibetensis TaxID=2591470 RepID=A0A563EYJ8_9PSEU|nr:hypothetical protein FKR81_10480 [Lentzea tibetensis]
MSRPNRCAEGATQPPTPKHQSRSNHQTPAPAKPAARQRTQPRRNRRPGKEPSPDDNRQPGKDPSPDDNRQPGKDPSPDENRQRPSPNGQFLDALDRVAKGGAAFDPEVVRRLLNRSPLERLTPREKDVLALMAQGLTNARISEDLHISLSAAEKHINAIFDKLGLAGSTGVSRRVMAVVRHLGSTVDPA